MYDDFFFLSSFGDLGFTGSHSIKICVNRGTCLQEFTDSHSIKVCA